MRVNAVIQETTLTNDYGHDIDGVEATCCRCGHTTESFGNGENARRRCLALLREECPNCENNFYVEAD